MITETLSGLFVGAKERAQQLGKALVLFEPEAPFRGKGLVTVLVTSASLITVTILGGVSLSCLLVLLVCLSMIMLILTRVLGIDFEMAPEEIFGYRP